MSLAAVTPIERRAPSQRPETPHLDEIKREFEGKPQWWTFLTHDWPEFIGELRRGIEFWAATQRRAGLSGEVAVWSTRDGAPKEPETVSLDDVDGILHRAMGCIQHDLTQYHDAADWPAAHIPRARFSLGVLDKTAGRLLSAIAHDGDSAEAAPLRADDADEMDAAALRAGIDRYLDGEGPAPRQIVGKDYDAEIGPSARRQPWRHMRALRCVASTIQGGVLHGGVTFAAGAIRAAANVFALLDGPAEREWSVSDIFPDGCWLGREGDDFPSPWEHDIEEPIVKFEAFDFHVADMIALGSIAYSRNGDPSGLPIVSRTELSDRLGQWYGLQESIALYKQAVPRADEASAEFLVPGILPLGAVTVLGSSPGAGKSATMLHLMRLVGIPPDRRATELSWMGVPAEQVGYGASFLVSAEEAHEEIKQRLSRMRVGKSSGVFLATGDRNIDDILADLVGIPNLKLVVLDNLRRFCDGDIDRNEVVTPWMAKLEAFARRKNCSVIVIHHFNKGAGRRPGSLVDDLHGSGAIVSSARVVMTMRKRAAGQVSVRVELSKLVGVTERELGPFVRDERTFTLAPTAKVENAEVEQPHDVAPICAALAAALADGRRITSTGPRELFELKRPELEGWRRARIRRAVQAAIVSGRVRLEDGGGLTMSAAV